MSETVTQETEWKPSRSPWFIIMPVILATFMYALDETVANVALPHIAGSYSVSNQESMGFDKLFDGKQHCNSDG